MRVGAPLTVRSLVFACNLLCFASCSSTSSTISSASAPPKTLAGVLGVTSYSPPAGVVKLGTPWAINISNTGNVFEGAYIFGIAFISDEGTDDLNHCGGSSGGTDSSSTTGYDGVIDQSSRPIWKPGHTVRAVLIASVSTPGDFTNDTRPCLLAVTTADGEYAGPVNWSKVQYQKAIATWTIQAQ